ncbi:anti-sigma regulatory factor (Ser/Thr protein kinase) [Catenuloplanes nepalensis]|uniref:Anti-sigma regulatory factor (Ser/Thr protein kinase) n=1 Tax=Catenuloplanes nepalensis TaxID=587533 RepID=A0ABT9N527_9ACTN|nr:ATP-binding SpoIIE family protein phosphatase [Catenuloplanes nepalensis]MDP9798809.1 anti-sigma regulatory factor (Ser/Thr protein kinase) [Catenuloplanes nepalensis]
MSDEGTWFRIDNTSVASTVRRAADRLAETLGLAEGPAADLSIVVAEMTSNLLKHAVEGSMLLRPVRTAETAGVEVIASDSGPGMADLPRFMRDGHTTSGTLGIGLGAIARRSSWCDMHSVPGKGTTLAVQVWPGAAPEPAWAAGTSRPITGEQISGDGYAIRVAGDRHQVLVSDGLGHGPLAAAASQAAVNAFRHAPAVPPAALVENLHRAMSHTRGAALAIAELDAAAGLVRYAGLGNIAGTIVEGSSRRGMISLPGIAGHQRRQIKEFEYPIGPGAAVVMHSDGVVDRWAPGDYPGLSTVSPVLVAATVLRDAGVRRDDACVLAARLPS